MSEATPEQMSRGVFNLARSLSQMEGGLERALEEKAAAEAQRDAARQETAELLAYHVVLREENAQLEASNDALVEEEITAKLQIEAKLSGLHQQLAMAQKAIDDLQYAEPILQRKIRDVKEEYALWVQRLGELKLSAGASSGRVVNAQEIMAEVERSLAAQGR
jgi:hypothetical protein